MEAICPRTLLNHLESSCYEENAYLLWQAVELSALGVKKKKSTVQAPKYLQKWQNLLPNHSPVVQHQTMFLICQQSPVQSQWASSIPHFYTHRAERYVHTKNAERERGAVQSVDCRHTFLSLHCEWTARMRADRSEETCRKVNLCVYVCVSYLDEKGRVWQETQCTLSVKPSSVTLVPSHIACYCRQSCCWPAAQPESRYHQPTSLIGACMQIISLFILIDDYIHKLPAVKYSGNLTTVRSSWSSLRNLSGQVRHWVCFQAFQKNYSPNWQNHREQ